MGELNLAIQLSKPFKFDHPVVLMGELFFLIYNLVLKS
jgi:hypothetical protein